MQNTVSNSPNSPNLPKLPFSNEPISWLEPLVFKFNQLSDVSAAATRAGFRIVLLKVLPGGYEAHCQRNHATTGQPAGQEGPPENIKGISLEEVQSRVGNHLLRSLKLKTLS